MKAFQGKVAVITGAGSGLGQALAKGLVIAGCHVALVDVSEESLQATKVILEKVLLDNELLLSGAVNVSCHVIDVASRVQMEALPAAVIANHGRVDLLFNNAGVVIEKRFETQSIEDWERMLNINLWGVIYGCKFFLPHLVQQAESYVVNTSSLAGFLGMPSQTAYCATKAAVKALSEGLYAEYRGRGVNVVSVHPGAVNTNIFAGAIASSDDPVASEKMFAMVKKMAMKPDVAAAKILKAVQKKRQRVVVGLDAKLVDVIKRLMPVLVHRIFSWGFQKRMQH